MQGEDFDKEESMPALANDYFINVQLSSSTVHDIEKGHYRT